MVKQMTKKMKLGLLLTLIVLIMAAVTIIIGMVNALNPPAELGEMRVSSSGQTIVPVSNTLKVVTDNQISGSVALILEEISDKLPQIIYDGDIAVNYTKETLEDFSFTMYSMELEPIYENLSYYKHPEESGEYIAKIQFSWGFTEKNSIFTENYFRVVYP